MLKEMQAGRQRRNQIYGSVLPHAPNADPICFAAKEIQLFVLVLFGVAPWHAPLLKNPDSMPLRTFGLQFSCCRTRAVPSPSASSSDPQALGSGPEHDGGLALYQLFRHAAARC